MRPPPHHSTQHRKHVETAPRTPPTDPDARMTVEVTPGGTVVVGGEIDGTTSSRLYRTLVEAQRAHPEGVGLDLSAVSFCDCAGLRAFLAARRDHHGGACHPLTLGPVSPRMDRLLALTGTRGLFAPPETGGTGQ
ncbi:STAS domain-containing protein [Streptomyces sp. Qhu_M48]|uniref:STAS domain-containing protein n=1 Tax=Streptomyces sp. Qhu_M48 TaxID=3435889 RepID=UPI003F4FA5D8